MSTCRPNATKRAAAARLAPILLGGLIGSGGAACAEATNVLTGTDFPSFQVIAERNIFNANRSPGSSRSRGEPERRVVVESVALAGTMSYEKGIFAVFDGTQSDYRKVLKVSDSVAGHQLVAIEADHVVLAAGDRRVELKVGQQLTREDGGPWEVRERSSGGFAMTRGGGRGEAAANVATESTGAAPAAESGNDGGSDGGSGGAGEDEVLKRLLEKRAKESNP